MNLEAKVKFKILTYKERTFTPCRALYSQNYKIKETIMEDFDKIIADVKPTLVDFYATWCGPCKMQSPIIDQVKETLGDEANVLKVDVDAEQELAMRYNVRSIPTLIVFKRGEPVWRGYGVHTADVLETRVREYMGERQPDVK